MHLVDLQSCLGLGFLIVWIQLVYKKRIRYLNAISHACPDGHYYYEAPEKHKF